MKTTIRHYKVIIFKFVVFKIYFDNDVRLFQILILKNPIRRSQICHKNPISHEITKHHSLFDGILIPVNKKNGIVTKDSNLITNFYGAIELKKTAENLNKKKSKAHFSQLTGQPFAQLIVANANENKPVFYLSQI